MCQTLDEPLVDELVQHRELVGAAIHHLVDDVLQHVFRKVHVVFKVGEGDLGLDHPELSRVALRVGVLRAKRRPEGVHVTEGHGEVLGIELAGHGKACRLAEEIAAPVDFPCVKFPARLGGGFLAHARHVLHIERGHAEHLACPLAVGRRDDRGIYVDEPAVLEEAVNGRSRDAADAENGAEEVRARTEVLLGAQELDRGALLLQRVVRRGGAFNGDALGGELEGLLRLGGELQRTLANKGGAYVLSCDLVVVLQRFAAHHHLEVAKAASVVQGDETEVLHVAHRADPTRHGDFGAPERVDVGEQLGDFRTLHHSPSLDMRKRGRARNARPLQ